jgi:Uncharacterised nucleotidyltransferase
MSPADPMPATPAPVEPAWPILLAACSVRSREEKSARLRPLLEQAVPWSSLFDLADRHGLTPLFYQTLSALEIEIPPNELRTLRDSYHRNLHKALFLSRELIRILQHLAVLGIEVLPYKGLALAETMYGDIALRHSGDIDLLIHPQDLARVAAAVRDLGYSPHASLSPPEQRAYLRSGYELSFDGEAGPNLLEVQWALQPRFYAVDYDMTGIFERAVSVSVTGFATKTLSPEDSFLVLSLHAAKHVWGRLIWLRDIAQIVAMPSLDWSWIEVQGRELGIARLLGVTLLLANKLLAAPIPQPARSFTGDSAADLVEEIQAHIVHEEAFDVESLRYFRLMLRLRERRSDRLRFLARLALTPGPNEWKAVSLPAPLFPLYRLVRLVRIAARMARR